jgi:hypothetical protein
MIKKLAIILNKCITKEISEMVSLLGTFHKINGKLMSVAKDDLYEVRFKVYTRLHK